MLENIGVQAIRRNWWMLALRGVLAIIFGLIALLAPGIALLAFVYVFAVYALIDGIMELVTAFAIRGFAAREWVLGLAGILSILFGILFIVRAFQMRSWASSVAP